MSASVFLTFVLAQVNRDSQVPNPAGLGERQSQIFVTLLQQVHSVDLVTARTPRTNIARKCDLSCPRHEQRWCHEIHGEVKHRCKEILLCQWDPWEYSGSTELFLLIGCLRNLQRGIRSCCFAITLV